jgi:hypothetical protein
VIEQEFARATLITNRESLPPPIHDPCYWNLEKNLLGSVLWLRRWFGAQSSERRLDAVTRRHRDDAGDHRHGEAARHRGARPHHCRQAGPRQPQGAEANLAVNVVCLVAQPPHNLGGFAKVSTFRAGPAFRICTTTTSREVPLRPGPHLGLLGQFAQAFRSSDRRRHLKRRTGRDCDAAVVDDGGERCGKAVALWVRDGEALKPAAKVCHQG